MPGNNCAVSGCNNNSFLTRQCQVGKPIFYHRFPKPLDVISSQLREKWIQCCCRGKDFNPHYNSRVCSAHFTDDDYKRDLRNELLGLPLRKILKETAVPNTNLPRKLSHEVEKNSEDQESIKKDEKRKVESSSSSTLLSNIQEPSCSTENHNVPSPESIPVSLYDELLKKINNLEKENVRLKEENLQLKRSTSETRRKIMSLNKQLKYYRNQSKKTNKLSKMEISHNLLRTILTENQIAILLNKKKRVNWQREEIAVAFTLRYYSKKCYIYLRNKLKYPLPGLSSLRRWASRINVSQGTLYDILALLNVAGEHLSDFEKTVVLQFDEVKVKSVLEYDTAADEVLGPYNQMQVVMARGLFHNWKQPIYIDFDQKMTKAILTDLISRLHDISYNVVACVSDCGGSNVGLWKELQVDIEHTSFKHPRTENNIYMFADAPHLLKLLRNWLLDSGFQLDNKLINKEPLESLIQLTNSEVNVCYKISHKHLNCEKSQRQNVRMAAQLLSNTVGTALLRYKPGKNKQLAEDVGNFICDINKWFDIFNSYTKKGNVPSKNAYGVDIKLQEEHLNKIVNVVSNMKVCGKTCLQTFQKGIIMSIQSLKSLYEDMKAVFKINYICTHKLNQDSLENFFFQIRSRGPNEHPSPIEAIKRIRMIILGKNPGILDAKVNTHDQAPEDYVVAHIMNKTKVTFPDLEVSALDESVLNSGSSSTFSSLGSEDMVNEEFEETTDDALEYLAGYLAKKFKTSMPHLGDYTYKANTDHNYNLPTWVMQLSYGGLIKPSEEWLKKIKKWNRFFEKFNGESFHKRKGIVKHLAQIIYKRENMPLDIIKSFFKLRLIIRINYKNAQFLKISIGSKRKLEFTSDTNRKKAKKLNKIVN